MDSLVSLFKAEPFKKEYEINGVNKNSSKIDAAATINIKGINLSIAKYNPKNIIHIGHLKCFWSKRLNIHIIAAIATVPITVIFWAVPIIGSPNAIAI